MTVDIPSWNAWKTRCGPSLALLLRRGDADREVAYDRGFALRSLAEALDKAAGNSITVITVVSMSWDWNTVFGDPAA